MEHSPSAAYKADGQLRDIERDISKYNVRYKLRIASFGIENQTDVSPHMPIRTIGYDGADYRAQLNKKNGKEQEKYPVITIVLYFGNKHWDKPKKLSECFNVPEEYLPYFNDYKINLFEIAFLPEETVSKFKSDFRIVADYFVQSRTNSEYKPPSIVIKHVQETLQLLSIFTNDRRFEEVAVSDFKGGVTMSNIIDSFVNKGRIEGKIEGYIKAAFSFGASEDNIISGIIKEFSLSKDSAMEYMEKFRPVMQ